MPPLPPGSRPATTGVTAVLGPTNTGKTHHAIERMLSFPSGVIGLPLRLLAREVYNRVVARVGAQSVALVTGEEKIKPRAPAYWISTVEAMPRDIDVDFRRDRRNPARRRSRPRPYFHRPAAALARAAGDAADRRRHDGAADRRAVSRRADLHAPAAVPPELRRREENFAPAAAQTAIVAFSAEEVYAIAEWIKRQRGGAAVVLGALSPRTRNAQVELFQSGDVDYIVATDAIGMGLNLDVDYVAFASDRKFDGWRYRRLTPAEFGQIAGPRRPPYERRRLRPDRALPAFRGGIDRGAGGPSLRSGRSFSSGATAISIFPRSDALSHSLDRTPDHPRFTRAPIADDQLALEAPAATRSRSSNAKTPADVARLWEACQIPDYRKTSPAAHADLALPIFGFVARTRQDSRRTGWRRHIDAVDRIDGDIDTLSNRLAQVRTVSFIANRSGWLDDAEHWQSVARRVEDSLSDALHERLTQRFVDRRTSVLMRRLRENAMLEAEINAAGDVLVEGQHVGSLQGFRFTARSRRGGRSRQAL